ncbi:hypothetical protein H0O02_03805 [Candidatus Micrarchaeota archaeon]|nr:hypothetical protein [Candidatus Micrarchaeota archaeon]
MEKQTFGGDDDSEQPAAQQKKLKLSKFELGPDYNIREIFWKIMASYATTKSPGMDLAGLHNQRIALMRSALSVMESRESGFYGLSPQFIARYAMMMALDAGWEDAFLELIGRARESRAESWQPVVQALKHLLASEKYRKKAVDCMKAGIRNSGSYPSILFYVPKIGDKELVSELKREISIYARGDVDENQLNALDSLAMLAGEEDVKGMLLSLLSHWNVDIRRKVAGIIKGVALDEKSAALINRRIEAEPDEEIKRVLKKKVMSWKK